MEETLYIRYLARRIKLSQNKLEREKEKAKYFVEKLNKIQTNDTAIEYIEYELMVNGAFAILCYEDVVDYTIFENDKIEEFTDFWSGKGVKLERFQKQHLALYLLDDKGNKVPGEKVVGTELIDRLQKTDEDNLEYLRQKTKDLKKKFFDLTE